MVNKKLLSILSILCLLLPVASAFNITFGLINMTAPSNINYSYNISSITYNQPIYCGENTSNINDSCSITRCDITRTLNNGETYVRDDNYCNLNIGCPATQECSEIENITYKINWKVYEQGSDMCISYLQDNITNCFPKSSTIDFETQYQVSCPSLEEYENQFTKKVDEWKPVNITQDKWYWLCIEPFSRYSQGLVNYGDAVTNFTTKLVGELAVCTNSNNELAERNGLLVTQAGEYTRIKDEYDFLKEDNLRLKNELENSGNPIAVFLCWTFGIIMVIGGLLWWTGREFSLGKLEDK